MKLKIKTTFIDILENASNAEGVQIFIDLKIFYLNTWPFYGNGPI